MLGPDSVRRQRLMRPFSNFFRIRAAENVNDVVKTHTETALHLNPKNTGKDLLRLHCAVDSLTGSEAVVAGSAFGEWFSASTLVRFSEVLEELDTAACRALAELDELGQVPPGNGLLLRVADIVEQSVQSDRVRRTVQEHAFAG